MAAVAEGGLSSTAAAAAPGPWAAVALEPGAELIIGWRPRRCRLDAAAVELSAEVGAEVHARCAVALGELTRLARRPYGGSPYIEPGEEYLAIPADQLPVAPSGRAEAGRAGAEPGRAEGGGVEAGRAGAGGDPDGDGDEESGLSDLQRLIAVPGLPSMSAHDLRSGRYLFYAAICRDARTGHRIGFVRQADPHRVAKAGGFMALLGQEGLQRLQDPVFVFEGGFDLIVAPGEIAVLRLEAFHRTFADLHAVASAAPANAKLIADVVDRLSPAAVNALASAAAASPSLARRLQRLARPGAVPPVAPGDISAAMIKHSLDPAEIISQGEIAFAEDHASVFLDLIEQLYYEADFTGEHRRSDRYSPLRR